MTEQNLAETTTVGEAGGKRDLLWLAPALLSAASLFSVYVATHPYPSFGAGLYLHIAGRIVEAGYALPETIPHYTAGGVPFSYPPLMFYVVAAIRDFGGVDPITISRVLPGAVTVAYLVPVYLLARDLLGSRPQGALASLLVAVSPPVLRWHISAGGMVRAPAFLFALTGVYAGLRLYRDRDVRWVVPSLVLFTLTVLTHPVYTVFFGLSYVLLFVRYDRTLQGLALGAAVAFGGVVLAAPWWTKVVAYHGPEVFAAAAGTHGGIGGGLPSPSSVIGFDFLMSPVETLWSVVPLLGVAYLLRERRYFLPAWLVVVAVVLGKPRFSTFVGAFVTAVFLLEVIRPRFKRGSRLPAGRRGIMTASLVLIAAVGLAAGGMYATGQLDAHAGSPALPQFIDHDDVEAMEWVQRSTSPTATFVVQGDAAEWFPQQTHRTLLVGPWGVEWEGHDRYARHLGLFRDLSGCNSARCMTRTLESSGGEPDYVYLPKGRFTVRGMTYRRTSRLAMSMHLSPRYRTVFENDGVIIFEVLEGTGGGSDARAPPAGAGDGTSGR